MLSAAALQSAEKLLIYRSTVFVPSEVSSGGSVVLHPAHGELHRGSAGRDDEPSHPYQVVGCGCNLKWPFHPLPALQFDLPEARPVFDPGKTLLHQFSPSLALLKTRAVAFFFS